MAVEGGVDYPTFETTPTAGQPHVYRWPKERRPGDVPDSLDEPHVPRYARQPDGDGDLGRTPTARYAADGLPWSGEKNAARQGAAALGGSGVEHRVVPVSAPLSGYTEVIDHSDPGSAYRQPDDLAFPEPFSPATRDPEGYIE